MTERALRSVLIANPKGGAGKSTLATNVAGHWATQGARVMLGDIDRQQSARHWLGMRSPLLAPISTWELEPEQPAEHQRPCSASCSAGTPLARFATSASRRSVALA